jgi:lipopolysaccharide/colanic/teichoic acid biosynthesis glycosyltransferase
MNYDLEYVDTRSFLGDLRIVLKTFGVVARREGAR